MELIDGSNRNGSLDLTVPDTDPASLFPIQVTSYPTSLFPIQVTSYPHPSHACRSRFTIRVARSRLQSRLWVTPLGEAFRPLGHAFG